MSEAIIHTWKVERAPFGVAKRRHVTVGKEAIQGATCDSPGNCVVARALKQSGAHNPLVSWLRDGTISIGVIAPNGERYRDVYRNIPQRVLNIIARFDAGLPIQPFEFSLEHGLRYRVMPWVRVRYAGGPRRKGGYTRKDKGALRGRSLRRMVQAAQQAAIVSA
jgi:hypothetical protein